MHRRASFLIFVAVVCGSLIAVNASAVTYTWNGGSAAWNASTNWTPNRAAVANTDVLLFNGGGATTATNVPAETIGQLLVSNNTNVTLQSAGAVTVTINGLAGTDLQVDAGSQLNFTGTANAITMNVVAGQTGSIAGAMTLSGTASVPHRLTAASASGITFQNGAVFTQGTNQNGNVFGTGTANSIVFASGSTFVFQSGSNPFALGQPASVVVFQTGSLYKHQSSNTPAFSGRTYANFELVSGTISPNGSSAVSIDNLTVTGGSLTFAVSGAPGHSIKGNISVASGATLNFSPNPANATTINLNGGSGQSIANAGTLTLNSAVETINVNNANGITLNSDVTFQQGVLQLTNGNITVSGANTLTINSGASVSRTSGHVIGNLRKDFAANGSKVFEVGTANGYSPFTANVTAGTPGNITCSAVQGAQPNMNASTSIARYWPLSASAGITADLTFQYLAGDVNGIEANYKVFRVTGGVPTSFPASSVNTGTHTATLAGVSTFSDWTVGEAGGPPPTPTLNISDVTLAEGDPAGTTTFTFAVTLDVPAGAGGVTFDIATADGTAQDDNPVSEDNDYVAQSLTGQTIAAGSTGPYNFSVTVNRDTTVEPNETFFVDVTNIVGAAAGDTQGLGTINNDDVAVTFIHDIQGNGTSSPITGSNVNIRGIVTGVKSNGFFVQEEDADTDADPATSEGIFVFTSSAPPAAAAFTAQVQVDGTVSEFVPSADSQQPPLTELTSPTVTQLLPSGQPLPTAVTLTPTNPDPAGPFDQMEKYEGMRVSAASMTVVGPSDGSVNEANATGTSNGRFHAVVTGVARPFREPGVQAPDLTPTGTIPPIPRWDTNPERLRVESATINSQPALTVKSSDVISAVAGPLDYGFRGYAIYPDGTLGTPVVTPGTLNTMVATPTALEFTVASYNLERFFDTVNDPESDAVLTATAFNNRLLKASIAIRSHLKYPDIIGVQEMEHLSTLQALATQINNDAVALDSLPNPMYVAYLTEGNDVGGIDVGYLVKTAPVTGGAPRVAVNSVTQVGAATTYIDPTTGAPDTLNDRPPLVLDATINRAPGASFNVIVINNHLRSLIGLTDETVSGASTTGDRVRRKRQIQADFLAQYIQGRLTATPTEHIVVIGDMNNFEFNDGYQDSLDTIAGTPVPDNQTVVCATTCSPATPTTGDGVDQLNPDLTNLVNTPPAPERYSYVFDGNAQNIDHALISPQLVTDTAARRIEHPRIDADYPETERNTNTTAFRTSDHDPIVAYFTANALAIADLSMTKADSPDPVTAGTNLTYTITATNSGPDPATTASWSDTIPAGTTFVSVSAVAGWTCTDPGVGNNGSVSCSTPSFAVGGAVFTLIVHVDATVAAGTVLSNTATTTSPTSDPDSGDLSDTATTTVAASADLSITKTDTPDPVNAGNQITYTITVTNAGPSNATNVTLTDTLPAGTTFAFLAAPGAWVCPVPPSGGPVVCTHASLPVGTSVFTIKVIVDPSTAAGTVLTNTAALTADTSDPNTGNESDSATTTVAASADLSITKTDTPDPVNAGNQITYTVTVTNAGPSNATNVTLTDTLPAGTTFAFLAAPGAWVCPVPPSGGPVVCTHASLPVGTSVFTIKVIVDPSTAAGTVLTNTAQLTAATSDPNSGNESSTATTTVATSADVSVTKTDSPDPVTAGTNLTYTITVANAGPSNAASVTLADTLPAGTTFVSLSSPGGWSCTTPAVGGTGTVNCSIASLGAGNAVFTLVINVDPGTPSGAITNTATAASTTPDPNIGNESATATTTVGGSADISVTKTDSPDPISAGSTLTFTITVANAGPSDAANVSLADTIPAGTTFLNLASPGGWSCSTPGVGGTGTINCSIATFPVSGSAVFTLLVQVNSPLPNGTIITNTATAASTSADPVGGNNSATTTTTVMPITNFTATKAVSGTFVSGTTVTYTVVLTNNMGHTQGDNFANEFADILPAGLALTGATASSGTIGTILPSNIVTWNGSIPNGASVTITITATITAASGTISNQGNAIIDTDNNGFNESGLPTDDPSTAAPSDPTSFTVVPPSADLSVAKSDAPDPVSAGANLTYTITVTNNGPNNAANVNLSDTLPTGTTFVSLSSPGGWSCTTPAVGAAGTVSCSITPLAPGSAVFTLVVNVNASVGNGTVISNTATASTTTSDPGSGNNSATTTTTVTASGDTDGDGVPDTVEQAAPNGGDGNGDGIPDDQQGTVASLPAATGTGYLTLQSSCQLQQVSVTTAGAMPVPDHGFAYPNGLISFRAPCSSATFSLFVYGSGATSVYRKFGPLPPGGPQQWYGIPATFSTATVGSLHPRRVDFSLTDGGTGDDTPVDGVIVDQGGPATPAGDAPTLSEWALIAMALALAAFAALKLRT